MRKATEKTRYSPKDLADQPMGAFLLRFEKQGLPPTVLWVDGVTVSETTVQAYRTNDDDDDEPEVVAAFSPDYTWFMLDQDLIDLATVRELLDRERINMFERARAAEDLAQAYKLGLGPDTLAQMEQRQQNRFLDDDDVRRLLGGE